MNHFICVKTNTVFPPKHSYIWGWIKKKLHSKKYHLFVWNINKKSVQTTGLNTGSFQGQRLIVLLYTEALIQSASPEFILNTRCNIIVVGADLFLLLCSSSGILAQRFKVLSYRRITPDSLLTGMGKYVCVCRSLSKSMSSTQRTQDVYLRALIPTI